MQNKYRTPHEVDIAVGTDGDAEHRYDGSRVYVDYK